MNFTQPVRILLVEDEPAPAAAFALAIQTLGGEKFALTVAGSLAAAAREISSRTFDVVLLDLNLPDGMGLSTFSIMRLLAPHLPIIILSGLDGEELALESVRLGAQDYLVKGSMSMDLLMRSIRYAIERHRLEKKLADYAEQLRLRNLAMEEELRMARQIQRAYLPLGELCFPHAQVPGRPTLRVHSLYEPAAELGGDFFDLLEISDSELGVFICDVMGHGVSAGLISGILRGVIEEARPLSGDPAEFLCEINHGMRGVLGNTEGTIFASAFYLVADLARGEVRHANAGHPYPLCFNRRTGLVAPVHSGVSQHGPALGLYDQPSYSVGQAPLSNDELFVLFTDGLSDADSSSSEPYGGERLPNAIRNRGSEPPMQLFEFLLRDVKAFAGRESLEDDICILSLEAVAPVSEPTL